MTTHFFSDQYLNSHDLHVPIISYDFEEKSDSDQESELEFHFPKKTFYTIYVQLILHSNTIQRTEQNRFSQFFSQIFLNRFFSHE